MSASWPGFSGIRNLVIFGDSYSSIGYPGYRHKLVPTSDNPLGIPFPGDTWNEPGEPNWVGHLITKYRPGPKFCPSAEKQSSEFIQNPLLVYDYAVGGHTVAGVSNQVESWFLPEIGKRPEGAAWSSENTLFVTWVGINDCAFSDIHERTLEKLFDIQEKLYNVGARNFLFIDVPTVHRSPTYRGHGTAFENWNSELLGKIESFSSSHEDVTAFMFSSYSTFNSLLDDPETYGFNSRDVKKYGGSIWIDHIHPTTRVHDFIANDIADFLSGIERGVSTSN
ncbi:hypothetical protein BDQ17DRAFT_1396000 [Cyathus striatus]|nr:hypothetical protein BDQ17DRAFT_1396000 [Cyathus striatus]